LHLKFCSNKPTNNKDGKSKGDVGEAMVFKPKAKPQVKLQIKPMNKVEVVAWPLLKINLFSWRN
jgi:hypothetical protein